MAVILGIDPGSRVCGYGLINAAGNRLQFIDCGCIRVASLDFPQRLQAIHQGLCEVIRRHNPQQAAMEEVFLGRNVSSALKLGQARGAAMVACTNHELEVAEYAARKVKQALVGSGRAEKKPDSAHDNCYPLPDLGARRRRRGRPGGSGLSCQYAKYPDPHGRGARQPARQIAGKIG